MTITIREKMQFLMNASDGSVSALAGGLIDQLTQVLTADLVDEEDKEDARELTDLYRRTMLELTPAFQERLLDEIIGLHSPEEIDAAYAFFSSPEGKAFRSHNGQIVPIVLRTSHAFSEEIQAACAEEANKIISRARDRSPPPRKGLLGLRPEDIKGFDD